jgi:hypothetical protein
MSDSEVVVVEAPKHRRAKAEKRLLAGAALVVGDGMPLRTRMVRAAATDRLIIDCRVAIGAPPC